MRRAGQVSVTAGARGGDRRVGIKRPLWIDHSILAQRQALLATIDVAQREFSSVAGRARWTHCRKPHIRKIIDAAAKTYHGISSPERREIVAGVNAMNQKI